jgi:hypothetical protein
MRRNWSRQHLQWPEHQSIGHLALNIREAEVEAETCLKPCNTKPDSRERQRPWIGIHTVRDIKWSIKVNKPFVWPAVSSLSVRVSLALGDAIWGTTGWLLGQSWQGFSFLGVYYWESSRQSWWATVISPSVHLLMDDAVINKTTGLWVLRWQTGRISTRSWEECLLQDMVSVIIVMADRLWRVINKLDEMDRALSHHQVFY